MRKLDMNKLAGLTTADELLDSKYGKEGTPERDKFDAESRSWYESQIESGSYHVTMPKALHASLSEYVKTKGISISSFISDLVARELHVSC